MNFQKRKIKKIKKLSDINCVLHNNIVTIHTHNYYFFLSLSHLNKSNNE